MTNDDRDENLQASSNADDDGRTPDETADNLVKPSSTATGAGTTGGTTEEDVTDGRDQ